MNNSDIFILGVGHNTIVVIDLAEKCGYNVAGLYHYLDNRENECYFGHKIIGTNKDLFKKDLTGKLFAISVGNNDIRAELYKKIVSRGGKVATLIHPTAIVSKYAKINDGVQIHAYSVVDPDTEIDKNTIVSSKSSILHGSKIGKHCFLAPDVVLGANTKMDDFVFVGLNATILSNKVSLIGRHVVIGASAVVTKPIAPNLTVVGMPANPINKDNMSDYYLSDIIDMVEDQAYKDLYGNKLLILAGADVHKKIVRAAQELGVYTIVTDYLSPEDSPAKQIADEYWMLDITDIDAIVERARKEKIDGVLAFCIDPAQLPYLKVCNKLGIPCYGTQTQFHILTDKRLFKDYCKEHGVDVVPEYTIEDVKQNKVTYPVLVKPTNSRGSRGQTVCNNYLEIESAINIAKKESSDNNYLIERYMSGKQDMSFSYVVIGGTPYLLKIGDRYLGNVEDNLDRQHIATVLPSKRAEEYRNNIEPNVIKMIKSLGIKFGAVFLQGFYDNGKVYMYDPGMRFPGGDFDIVLKNTTGYDNMKTFVRFALTGDINSQYGNPTEVYKLKGNICLILSVALRPGKIAMFSGIEQIMKNPHVYSVCQRYKIGDVIPETGDIKQRAVEFVVQLPDRASIGEFLSFVYSILDIRDEDGNDMIISKLSTYKSF